MNSLVVLGALLVAAGCGSTANPRSCIDGVCSDPQFPFCDVEGTFGGEAKECIDVGCTAGVFERCVGADAYTCNAFGNSFDVETCATGCDDAVGGCRVCSTNTDCAASMPVCDVSMNQCRQCAIDSECDSQVCDRGLCVDQATILYASVDGSATASCAPSDRCALTTALERARMVGAARIVHLATGIYPGLQVPTGTTELTLVGQDATLDGSSGGLIVDPGAHLVARNLTIRGANDALVCGQVSMARASLALRDSTLVQPGPSRIVAAANCDLSLSATELRGDGSASPGSSTTVFLGTDIAFTGDRLHIHGLRTTMIGLMGQRMNVTITNSLLENVGYLSLASDSTLPGTSVTFSWSTFVSRNADAYLFCDGNQFRQTQLRYSILFGTAAPNVIEGTGCIVASNLLSPQSPLPLQNVTGDPQFENVASRDFRLKPTSPAVGYAGSGPISNDHDFVGAPRPQGGSYDIGAYEQ